MQNDIILYSAVFEPLFAVFKESTYEKKFILISSQTQSDVLLRVLLDEYPDRVHEIEELLIANTHREVLFLENPCHYDCWVVAIQEGVIIFLYGPV